VNKTIKIKTLKFCLKKLEMSEKKNAYNMLMLPRREQSEYIKLRVLYRDALEGKIENNMEKIGFFENYVLPSLAKQCEVTVNGICRKKYACLFPDCVSKKTLLHDGTEKPTFVDMQKYFRHLTTAHDQLLPGGGQFIIKILYKNIQFSDEETQND
jgi:hypothetical protein